MTPEKTSILIQKYPELFRSHRIFSFSPEIKIEIECGDGWFDLIDEMCQKLSHIPEVYFTQIKEKYGSLRVYNCGTDESNLSDIFEIIKTAEDKSQHTCEICGQEGELSGSLWYRTRCKSCEKNN